MNTKFRFMVAPEMVRVEGTQRTAWGEHINRYVIVNIIVWVR